MSKPSKLSNKKEDISNYIKLISQFKEVEEIYVFGSRAKGLEREDSDWDITVKVSKPTFRISKPNLHLDIAFVTDVTKLRNKVMVYPDDVFGLHKLKEVCKQKNLE